jgi:CyaY protein
VAGAADKLDSSSVINIQIILAIMEPTTPTATTAPTALTTLTTLTDSEYHRLSAAVLGSIEATVDRWLDDDVIDIDSHRTGGLLELSFPGGSKIIINTQPPLHELWVAARAGGFHYRWQAGRWCDTRDGSEFFAALSAQASAQGGRTLRFDPPA